METLEIGDWMDFIQARQAVVVAMWGVGEGVRHCGGTVSEGGNERHNSWFVRSFVRSLTVNE